MEELEKKLVDIFNDAMLPLEAKVYVVRSFHRLVEDAFTQAKKKQEVKSDEQMSQQS